MLEMVERSLFELILNAGLRGAFEALQKYLESNSPRLKLSNWLRGTASIHLNYIPTVLSYYAFSDYEAPAITQAKLIEINIFCGSGHYRSCLLYVLVLQNAFSFFLFPFPSNAYTAVPHSRSQLASAPFGMLHITNASRSNIEGHDFHLGKYNPSHTIPQLPNQPSRTPACLFFFAVVPIALFIPVAWLMSSAVVASRFFSSSIFFNIFAVFPAPEPFP
jgi:hypothetical protein